MIRYVTVVPAYGRDYRTKKEVLAAWEEGKDFHMEDLTLSGHINKSDFDKNNAVLTNTQLVLHIRYDRLRKVTEVR